MIGLLYGYFASNLGDIAITCGIAKLLSSRRARFILPPIPPAAQSAAEKFRENFPNIEMAFTDPKLEDALKGRSPPANEFVLLEDLLLDSASILKKNNIADCDTLVFTGGEHLFSNGSPRDVYALTGRLLPLLAAIAQGKKVLCLPATFGPFADPFSRSLVRTFIKGCSGVAVRESASLEQLQQLGLSVDDIPVLLDPAFFLDRPAIKPQRNLISLIARLDNYGMRIGGAASSQNLKAMRKTNFSTSTAISLYVHTVKSIAKSNKEMAFQILVQTQADEEVAHEIKKQASAYSSQVSVSRPETIDLFIEALARGCCTISSRFHGIIFSALAGRPSIGIYYPEHGHKIPGLMAMLDQQTRCFDGASLEAPVLAQKVADCAVDLHETHEPVSLRITATLDDLRLQTSHWISAKLN
jgi:polysaccharide pyruvyl transferase WcaK-like protein